MRYLFLEMDTKKMYNVHNVPGEVDVSDDEFIYVLSSARKSRRNDVIPEFDDTDTDSFEDVNDDEDDSPTSRVRYSLGNNIKINGKKTYK